MNANSSKRIPSLDGMRAVAALLVFFSHSQILAIYTLVGNPFLAALGELGVTAFFFLSGFIITTLLRDEYQRKNTLNFRNFYLRRVYRLAPPFILTMLAIILLVQSNVFAVPFDWPNYAGQLVQAGNYLSAFGDDKFMRATGTIVIWSLAVENHFYLLFPAVLLLLLSRIGMRAAAIVILLACLLLLAWRWVAWFELELGRDWLRHATDARIDTILAGCCMALWSNPSLDKVWTLKQPAGTVAVVICVAIILAVPLYPAEAISIVFVYAIQCVCLYVIYTLAMQHPTWGCFRWLNSRTMVWIGTVSYTVYLIHLTVLKALRNTTEWGDVTVAVSGLLLTLALASVSYRYIEGPLARLRKKLH